MTDQIYLIFDELGFLAAKKTDKFNMTSQQRAVCLKVTIPDEAFQPVGMLNMAGEIPLAMVMHPAIEGECVPLQPVGVTPED